MLTHRAGCQSHALQQRLERLANDGQPRLKTYRTRADAGSVLGSLLLVPCDCDSTAISSPSWIPPSLAIHPPISAILAILAIIRPHKLGQNSLKPTILETLDMISCCVVSSYPPPPPQSRAEERSPVSFSPHDFPVLLWDGIGWMPCRPALDNTLED